MIERSDRGERAGATAAGLPADVLEIVAFEAQAAGVSVADFIREAVLAYGAQTQSSLGTRSHEARRDTSRVKAESRAVLAQSGQAIARSHQALDGAKRRSDDGSG